MTISTLGLFNTNQGNSTFYNGFFSTTALPTSDEQISFNGYGLQNINIISSYEEFEKAPDRDFATVSRPQTNGMIRNSDYWRRKTIVVKGMLSCETASALETLIDTLKKKLSVVEKNLDIQRSGIVRRFISSAIRIDIQRNKHAWISSCPFELEFDCLTPFGENATYSADSYLVGESGGNDNGRSFTQILENLGSAPAQPYLVMVIRAVSSITKINFKNETTGEEVEITYSPSVDDVIIFDAEDKEVLVNGVDTDFAGAFPELIAGSNVYTITMTGTSCEYYFTAKTKAKWL